MGVDVKMSPVAILQRKLTKSSSSIMLVSMLDLDVFSCAVSRPKRLICRSLSSACQIQRRCRIVFIASFVLS